MRHALSNDNISVVFSRADFNSAVASGWKRLHLPYVRVWPILVEAIRSTTGPTTVTAGRSTQLQHRLGYHGRTEYTKRRWGWLSDDGQQLSSYEPPGGAVSMSHLSFWSPTTGTIGRCARRFCSHGIPRSSGTSVGRVCLLEVKTNMGTAVL